MVKLTATAFLLVGSTTASNFRVMDPDSPWSAGRSIFLNLSGGLSRGKLNVKRVSNGMPQHDWHNAFGRQTLGKTISWTRGNC